MKQILIATALLLSICPLFAQWDGTATPWTQGIGTESNPYIISSPEHLAYLANQVNSGTNYANQHFLLTNNISLRGRNWTPIGTSSHRFKGSFDGGGHTIDSLYIYQEISHIGLFGYVEDGEIKNVKCKGSIYCWWENNNYYVGGIAGYISDVEINACQSFVNIYYSYAKIAGGIVGSAYYSDINHCVVSGLVQGVLSGGIIGQSVSSTITDCIVESVAAIAAWQDDDDTPSIYKGNAGGIVGVGGSTIINCKNFASVGASHIAGGIIGRCASANVSECGNYGEIYVGEYDQIDNYAGGIVGMSDFGSITKCFNQGEIVIEAMNDETYSQHAYASGIVASMGSLNSPGVISYCYNSGDITITCEDEDDYVNAGLEYATGVAPYFSTYCTTSYSYNSGNISVLRGSFKYGVGPTSSLTGCYYRSGCGATSGGTSKTATQMQSSSFLSLLNVGESPFVSDAGNTNNGYPVLHFATRPIVTTDAASNRTSYTAELNGHFFGVADSIGFIYKQSSSTSGFTRVMLDNVSNPAMLFIDSLLPETYYMFSFFAYWEGELINGDTILFCTRPMFNIVVSSNNDNWGTTSGSGTYSYGETATLVATAIQPYVFSHWNDDNSNNPRNVTVTYNAQYMAIFALPQFTLTLHTNNPTWGGTSGSGQYQYGDSAFCVAVPYNGYHFVMWSDSVLSNSRFVKILSDTSLTAIFAPNQYTVTVLSNDTTKGLVYGGGTVNYNSTVQIYAVPTGNNLFWHWSDGSSEQIRTVTVTQDITYTAIFTGAMFTISTSASPNNAGYVTGGGTYPQDSTTVLTAVPYYGYDFLHWLDGNTDNPRNIIVSNNANYTAVFVPKIFHVSVISDNISMGSVSGSGDYQFNTQATIQAISNPHHSFTGWSDGVTNNPRTFTVVSDTSFTAYFSADPTFTVVVKSADSTKGYVTGGGTYFRGEQVTFSATPYPNYIFSKWNDAVTDAERTETVTSNITYIASFAGVPCTVNVITEDPSLGSVAGGGIYEYNDSVTITATPADGCYFVGWDNGVNTEQYSFVVRSDKTFIATFARTNGIDDVSSLNNPSAVVKNGKIIVNNAENHNVAVFDMLGRQLFSSSCYDGTPISLSTHGIFFVLVDNINIGKVIILH